MGKRGPKRRELTPEQSEAVERARAVASERRDVEAAYIEAIVDARAAGATLSAIADAIGVTHESVRQVVRRRGGE